MMFLVWVVHRGVPSPDIAAFIGFAAQPLFTPSSLSVLIQASRRGRNGDRGLIGRGVQLATSPFVGPFFRLVDLYHDPVSSRLAAKSLLILMKRSSVATQNASFEL